LTIEYISGKTAPGTSVNILTFVNGAGANHFLNLNTDGMGNFSQKVLIYADPGSDVTIAYFGSPHFVSFLKLTLTGVFSGQP
jgi:hypothetical protein